MIQPGWNDPCHCGSGKKYKKCHLEADQRDRATVRPLPLDPDPPSAQAFMDVKNLPKLFRRLSKEGSAEDRKEFRELLSKTEPVLEYMAHGAKIEAAEEILRTHPGEFEKLADPARYSALAQSVFSEECFAPLRFSASDVQTAFDQVGYPAMMSPDDQTVQTLRAAILHVAKERRNELSMRLLLQLPGFVAAGRYPEAWLLQCEAIETAEAADQPNAFLFKMFSYGYDAWAADKRAKDESLLRQLGLDPNILESMDFDELDSWVKSHASDPANTRAMEEFFETNPHLREQSVASLEALERNSVKLLEREDSRFLHLPTEEIQPWLMRFSGSLAQEGFSTETATEESIQQMFKDAVLPLMREMADTIFTPERIRQLIVDLKKYQGDLFTAGEKSTAAGVLGAINYLKREDSPGENAFLLALCWKSFGSAIDAATADTSKSMD